MLESTTAHRFSSPIETVRRNGGQKGSSILKDQEDPPIVYYSDDLSAHVKFTWDPFHDKFRLFFPLQRDRWRIGDPLWIWGGFKAFQEVLTNLWRRRGGFPGFCDVKYIGWEPLNESKLTSGPELGEEVSFGNFAWDLKIWGENLIKNFTTEK